MTLADAPASILRDHPAFLRFWFASTGSSFAFEMVSAAVGWQVYATTGRAFDLGLIGLVQFVVALWMRFFPTLRRRRRLLAGGPG